MKKNVLEKNLTFLEKLEDIRQRARSCKISAKKAILEFETAMMSEIIVRVNKFNPSIRVIYLFDSLEVDEKYSDDLKKIMNQVAKDAGVNTYAKNKCDEK